MSLCHAAPDLGRVGKQSRRAVQDRAPYHRRRFGRGRFRRVRPASLRSAFHRRPDHRLPAYRHRRGRARVAQCPWRRRDQSRQRGPDRSGRVRGFAEGPPDAPECRAALPLDRAGSWRAAGLALGLSQAAGWRPRSRRAQSRCRELGHPIRAFRPLPRARERPLGPRLFEGRSRLSDGGRVRCGGPCHQPGKPRGGCAGQPPDGGGGGGARANCRSRGGGRGG